MFVVGGFDEGRMRSDGNVVFTVAWRSAIIRQLVGRRRERRSRIKRFKKAKMQTFEIVCQRRIRKNNRFHDNTNGKSVD